LLVTGLGYRFFESSGSRFVLTTIQIKRLLRKQGFNQALATNQKALVKARIQPGFGYQARAKTLVLKMPLDSK